MKGKLIILEGTDASGKSTQFRRLTERLKRDGIDFRTVTFPRYKEDSSVLLRMYLGGEFGKNPNDVNAYMASTFFAVDRCASYLKDWRTYYENGGVLVFDRYTTSNAVHQASKMKPEDRESFIRWLFDYEYNLLGLPAPDEVFLLDMPVAQSAKLMEHRAGKTCDIHELDLAYLQECRDTAHLAAKMYGWQLISCTKDGELRRIEEIHEELYEKVLRRIRDGV